MELFHTFYFFYLSAAFIKCAPVERPSLYDAILQKCPTVTILPHFKEQPIFHTCNDWEKINKTQELTDNTKIDVLCLLYYSSYTQYCNQSKPLNTTPVDVDMNTICDNLDIIPKQVAPEDALRKIISSREDCVKLCSDLFGSVLSICSLSYHYSHLQESEKNTNHLLPVIKDNTKHFLAVTTAKKPNAPSSPGQEVQIQEENLQIPDKVNESQKNENTPHKEPAPVIADKVQEKVNAPSEQATNLDNKNPPQVSGGAQMPETKHEELATNNALKPSTEGANKVKTTTEEEKEKVHNQQKPVLAPTSPKNEENPNIDNSQLDKIVDNDFGPSDEGNQPNIESEEEMDQPTETLNEKPLKPVQIIEEETDAVNNYTTEMDGDSYFFTYFMLLCIIFIVGYVCYHNKQKILALILEGRRGKRQYRGRRPNSANYHKLDNNLEEAITSSCNKNTNNVIY